MSTTQHHIAQLGTRLDALVSDFKALTASIGCDCAPSPRPYPRHGRGLLSKGRLPHKPGQKVSLSLANIGLYSPQAQRRIIDRVGRGEPLPMPRKGCKRTRDCGCAGATR